jgi:hypothetical protein
MSISLVAINKFLGFELKVVYITEESVPGLKKLEYFLGIQHNFKGVYLPILESMNFFLLLFFSYKFKY